MQKIVKTQLNVIWLEPQNIRSDPISCAKIFSNSNRETVWKKGYIAIYLNEPEYELIAFWITEWTKVQVRA